MCRVEKLVIWVDILSPNKRAGWEKCKNANQVDSFIWHLRVVSALIFILSTVELVKNGFFLSKIALIAKILNF